MSYIISIIGLIINLSQVAKQNFPPKVKAKTMVRVLVGLDTQGGLSNSGGDVPTVSIFSEAGKRVGKYKMGKKVVSGEYTDMFFDHTHTQPTYALFAARDDAICVAAAFITWIDGFQFAWMGDWGAKCGAPWYYSNVYIPPSGIKPRCLWIDANNEAFKTGFQIHWPEFSRSPDEPFPDTPEAKEQLAHYLCTAGPPFTMYEHPNVHPKDIQYWVPQGANGTGAGNGAIEKTHLPRKRTKRAEDRHETSKRATESFMRMNLVVSDTEQHSAEELCNSPTSAGPDFFNTLTGTFCRMSDKTVWPACNSTELTDNCFNKDLNLLVVNGIAARSEVYSNVIDWTLGS
ncbi:hypothetical protein GGR51DRAFT_574634 [Nemania sp. FL0031]|nr:hypothetical protein GGR51DRAFT_574634 [Nemania sp. FL0031]